MSLEERIRRLLQQRLGRIGVSPDTRNDGPAVREIAAQLNIQLEAVVDQLVAMRTEQNMNMARRLGQASLSPGALTLLAASRDALLGGESYADAFHARAGQGVRELASSLGRQMTRERAVAV